MCPLLRPHDIVESVSSSTSFPRRYWSAVRELDMNNDSLQFNYNQLFFISSMCQSLEKITVDYNKLTKREVADSFPPPSPS